MKCHEALLAACFVIAGFGAPAIASPSSGDAGAPTAARHEAIQLAAAKTRVKRGGITTSTTDIDGDGTADVVTKSYKPKPKPVRRVRRHR